MPACTQAGIDYEEYCEWLRTDKWFRAAKDFVRAEYSAALKQTYIEVSKRKAEMGDLRDLLKAIEREDESWDLGLKKVRAGALGYSGWSAEITAVADTPDPFAITAEPTDAKKENPSE